MNVDYYTLVAILAIVGALAYEFWTAPIYDDNEEPTNHGDEARRE